MRKNNKQTTKPQNKQVNTSNEKHKEFVRKPKLKNVKIQNRQMEKQKKLKKQKNEKTNVTFKNETN